VLHLLEIHCVEDISRLKPSFSGDSHSKMGILQFLFSMGIRIDDDLASFFFGIFTPLESPATYGGE
jgi:hypothetical protein